MRLVPGVVRRTVYEFRLRRRFRRSVIHSGARVDAASRLEDWAVLFANTRLVESSLGRYSYVQENSSLYATEVGPYCSIAGNTTIGLPDHPTFMVSTSPVFYDDTQPLPRFLVGGCRLPHVHPRTVIEADVWIGEGVRIRAGVRIGIGSVIGAGSVVTRDVPPYTIAAGVPCRPIRRRFDEVICKRLTESEWWTLDEEKLLVLAPHFSDPMALLNLIEQSR